MGSHPKQQQRRIPPEERLNVFALVIYIPGALGEFLDDLRRELVPGCNPNAHVSLLPPRPLAVDWEIASQEAGEIIQRCPKFEIELTTIGVFPVTNVIYIEVGLGDTELRQLHKAMNSGALEFQDPFTYYPHITLAQELPHEDVAAVRELATRRWQEYKGEHRFTAVKAMFVQNSMSGHWIDLAEYCLGGNSPNS